jgi:hypothetical protein
MIFPLRLPGEGFARAHCVCRCHFSFFSSLQLLLSNLTTQFSSIEQLALEYLGQKTPTRKGSKRIDKSIYP